MAHIVFREPISTPDQLRLMQEDARFDVSDQQDVEHTCIPDLTAIAGDIRAKPGPPKVPKLMVSNDCRFNCAYCGCRCGNEQRQRYTNEPKEIARLACQEAVKNGHGVFLTSSICRDADYTEELIVAALKCMREELHYPGYIHAKIMPGADPLLIEQAGRYANRLSVNIEVANSAGYARIARQKTRENILAPMGQISRLIRQHKAETGRTGRRFATSQTTQLMAGSTGETDRTILTLSKALYRKYGLKRVYYTAFHYRHPAAGYDLPYVDTPSWRMARLYQADRLMELYGFTPEEIAPEQAPDLEESIDPKLSWALRHLDRFPVEVGRADYETLLRVPGIGVVYAQRILEARRFGPVSFETLQKLGVSMQRSRYFLQCGGRYGGGDLLEHPERLRRLLGSDPEQLLLSPSGCLQ